MAIYHTAIYENYFPLQLQTLLTTLNLNNNKILFFLKEVVLPKCQDHGSRKKGISGVNSSFFEASPLIPSLFLYPLSLSLNLSFSLFPPQMEPLFSHAEKI